MSKTHATKVTKDAAVLIQQMIAKDEDLASLIEEESFNADIAIEIYNARTEMDISQAELARLVGSKQSVISRLENADYDGHSLAMLRRIGKALGKRLRVEFFSPRHFPTDFNSTAKPLDAKWKKTGDWSGITIQSVKKTHAKVCS